MERQALKERDEAAEAFLVVSEAEIRALASPPPGLNIGPSEIENYMATALSNVPWIQ